MLRVRRRPVRGCAGARCFVSGSRGWSHGKFSESRQWSSLTARRAPAAQRLSASRRSGESLSCVLTAVRVPAALKTIEGRTSSRIQMTAVVSRATAMLTAAPGRGAAGGRSAFAAAPCKRAIRARTRVTPITRVCRPVAFRSDGESTSGSRSSSFRVTDLSSIIASSPAAAKLQLQLDGGGGSGGKGGNRGRRRRGGGGGGWWGRGGDDDDEEDKIRAMPKQV